MGKVKKYWTGMEELEQTEEFQQSMSNEFANTQSVDEFLADDRLKETNTGRRDFLKFLGFSVTAATLAACETPVIKSIPYVNKPEDVTPGVANWYASTYYDGHEYANILVKAREGRPIFIKGNSDHGLAGGGVNARINSSVLSLYDSARLRGPKSAGEDTSWGDLDAAVTKELQAANGAVAVLSNTIISPSTQRAIDAFNAAFGGRHVAFDAVSYNGISKAHENTHGKAAIPSYDFSKAKVIVSIGCDFLGTWMSSNMFDSAYADRRRPEGEWMSKHFQFESVMSLTGSNADERVAVKPSEYGKVAAALYKAMNGGSGKLDGDAAAMASAAAKELQANRGESIVVCGSNDPAVQTVVNAINDQLGNYGSTVDIDNPVNMYKGNEESFEALVNDMNSGAVKAIVVYGTNPSYNAADADAFNAALAKVPTTICFNGVEDETASRCKYIAPDHHALESWNDFSPVGGRVDLSQPTITPLFDTRYAQESLLTWSGDNTDYYTYLRQTHNSAYTMDLMATDMDWHKAVHNGTMAAAVAPIMDDAAVAEAAEGGETPSSVMDVSSAVSAAESKSGGTWELEIYQKVGIGSGSHTTNPWGHELPDPVTKVTWDNYVTMSPVDCRELGFGTVYGQRDFASVVKVSSGDQSITLPVYALPGQKRGTIGIAMGYGRGGNGENIGKAAYVVNGDGEFLTDENGNMVPVGVNILPFATSSNGTTNYANYDVTIEDTGETAILATTQMHNTVMGRDSIVKETTLAEYNAEKSAEKGKASWNRMPLLVTHEDMDQDNDIDKEDGYVKNFDMWHEHPVEEVGHRWGMTIDLNSCTGCSACVTACHIENNVPVVGKDEVHRHRDMHWMRIDRFFASDYKNGAETLEATKEATGLGTIAAYTHMEQATENPETVHMPMMCQHCNHAPCETVCPVAATTHSNEGLNQMAYNRCIGTRYCANNCPYKVRRFNWFNYPGYDKFKNINPAQDSLTRMVLNPDVTVRSRGVMEKCSLCVQRIQKGKLDAKVAGQPVEDGAIQTACAEACPSKAITFGDLNDKESQVTAESKNNRSYHALEEVGVQPNIFYMTKVRNKERNEA